MNSSFENPYAPSEVEADAVATPSDSAAEVIRHEYIRHEKSIQSLGVLFIIGGCGGALLMFVGMIAEFGGNGPRTAQVPWIILTVACVISLVQVAVGVGMRRLSPWSRIPAGILGGISALNVPVGTLIGLYVIYLMVSKKSTVVFSDEYKQVIEATPHIKQRTSKVIVVLLFVLLAVLALAVGAAFFA